MKTIENLSLNFTLLQGAEIFAPEQLGKKDILIADEKIIAIAENINPDSVPNCSVLSCHHLKICPGLIDQHVHLIGGGGEAGPYSRTPEVNLSTLIESGITTVVGLLGTDGITRHPDSLLAKTKALNHEGITAFMLTGAYTVPTPTITDSIQKDIAYIDPIIGVKTAISDHRSSAPTIDELCKIATSARVGGLLGNKTGLTVFHMGSGKNGLKPIYDLLNTSDVPISKLLPTHINRTKPLFDEAIEYAKQGGFIDLTSGISPEVGAKEAIKPSKAVIQALSAGVPLQQITMSSDGNGSQPVFDQNGQLTGITVAGFKSLMSEIKDMVFIEKLPLEQAIQILTRSVANLLQLPKGRIQTGMDADLLVLNADLHIEHVFARGKQVVMNQKACIKGNFE